MLMKIAMAEAEGESVEGKALVMLVVLNRVWSDAFPDTIEEVIFQPRQFTPAVPGGRYYTTEPDDGCDRRYCQLCREQHRPRNNQVAPRLPFPALYLHSCHIPRHD